MFGFIKNKLNNIYTSFSSKLSTLLGNNVCDQKTLTKLEVLLLSADTGVKTTREIIRQLKNKALDVPLHQALRILLYDLLSSVFFVHDKTQVFLLVGINGSGKTTFAGKLAWQFVQQGKKVLLVGADTFRAAAREQLGEWAQKSGAAIIVGAIGQDPASVVFRGCKKFKEEQFDILIIDTAGRLQTKINLMKKLVKIKQIVAKQMPHFAISTLLAIDAMLGQNSFEQAQLFKESTDLNGVLLSKMDGTGKGGIIFAIASKLKIPVAYLSYGEQIDQIIQFNPKEYVDELIDIKL